jgi:hypothetical protein
VEEGDGLDSLWNLRKNKHANNEGSFMPGHLMIQKILDIKKEQLWEYMEVFLLER